MLQSHQANIRRVLPEMMRAAGRLICVSLATSTTPYGTSTAARKLGETAVAQDIFRVYVPASHVYSTFPNQGTARTFWFHLQNRRYAQAQAIMDKFHPLYRRIPIRAFDGGAAHQAARVRGKVRKNQRPAMVVQADRRLAAYVRKMQADVGKAKGGWVGGANQFGGARGIPQWVTRHASGTAHENYTAGNYRVRIDNPVPYSTDALDRRDKELAIDIGVQRFLQGGAIRRAAHGERPAG